MIVMKLPMTPISPHTKVKTPSPQKSTFLIKVEFESKLEWQSSSDELLLFSPPKLMVDWIIVTSFTVVYWLSVSDIYNKAINISYSTNVKANLRLYKDITHKVYTRVSSRTILSQEVPGSPRTIWNKAIGRSVCDLVYF